MLSKDKIALTDIFKTINSGSAGDTSIQTLDTILEKYKYGEEFNVDDDIPYILNKINSYIYEYLDDTKKQASIKSQFLPMPIIPEPGTYIIDYDPQALIEHHPVMASEGIDNNYKFEIKTNKKELFLESLETHKYKYENEDIKNWVEDTNKIDKAEKHIYIL